MTPPPTALAPHHLRLFALIIDYLLITTVLKLVDQLALGEHWDLRPESVDAAPISAGWVVGLVALLLAKDMLGGVSPGKWFTGIAVKRAEDPAAAPPPRRLLLRNVGLVLLPVEAVALFLDAHARRLGDRWAGTVVVLSPAAAPLTRRVMGLAILVLAFLLAAFLVAPWNLRRSAAYQVSAAAVANHPGLVATLGEPLDVGDAPAFELHPLPDGGSARVTFVVHGPRGRAEAAVALRMDTAPRRWRVEGMKLVVEAPPPLVREAPGKK